MSGKYALIIANTEYTDLGLAQLTAPGKDAEDFAQVLEASDFGGFDDVQTIINPDNAAARQAIDRFFNEKKRDDLLVFYFSGHGIRDEDGSLYLAVKNTQRSLLDSTGIESVFIRRKMEKSFSKKQVLILDCCNSGAFAQGTKSAADENVGTKTAFINSEGSGQIILAASDKTQFAFEGDKVTGVETDNSLFTHYLIKGLKGEADNNSDGQITVSELYEYVNENVKRDTKSKQTPTMFANKQEGVIYLRQNMRIEEIKPISLPNELHEATEDSRTFVRQGAVQQLELLLKGKNLGLARSAREALARMEKEDDSFRVRQAATLILEPFRLAEQKTEEERKAREEADRLAVQKAEVERFAKEKRLDNEAEKQLIATQEAEEKRITGKAKKEDTANANMTAEHLAKEERQTLEKAAVKPVEASLIEDSSTKRSQLFKKYGWWLLIISLILLYHSLGVSIIGIISSIGMLNNKEWGRKGNVFFSLLMEIAGLVAAICIVLYLAFGSSYIYSFYSTPYWFMATASLLGFSSGAIFSPRLIAIENTTHDKKATLQRPSGILAVTIPLLFTLAGTIPALGLLFRKKWGQVSSLYILGLLIISSVLGAIIIIPSIQAKYGTFSSGYFDAPNEWGIAIAIIETTVIVVWCAIAIRYLLNKQIKEWLNSQ